MVVHKGSANLDGFVHSTEFSCAVSGYDDGVWVVVFPCGLRFAK